MVGSISSDAFNSFAAIYKYDPNGNKLMEHVYSAVELTGLDNAKHSRFTDIVLDSDSNIIVSGKVNFGGPDPHAGFVSKLSPDGEVIWSRVQNTELPDWATAVCCGPNDEIYVTGYRGFTFSNADVVLTKYDQDGILLWQQEFGGGPY